MAKRLLVERLSQFCTEALEKAGLRPEDAAIVADVLVMTDTWGTFSHGTGGLRSYLISLRAGGMIHAADRSGSRRRLVGRDRRALGNGNAGLPHGDEHGDREGSHPYDCVGGRQEQQSFWRRRILRQYGSKP